ncbi:MAG: hypothetical protein AB1489_39830 [Acidobacteriota bacterium]
MKFEELSPNGKDIHNGLVVACPQFGSCHVCGESTRWADVVLEASLCSEECARAMVHSYQKTIERLVDKTGDIPGKGSSI